MIDIEWGRISNPHFLDLSNGWAGLRKACVSPTQFRPYPIFWLISSGAKFGIHILWASITDGLGWTKPVFHHVFQVLGLYPHESLGQEPRFRVLNSWHSPDPTCKHHVIEQKNTQKEGRAKHHHDVIILFYYHYTNIVIVVA